MYPAQEGDAFLVSLESDKGNKNIIIDMGLADTYKSEMKPDLVKLKSKGQKIDLLIITHIDQDHIQGAIEFIKENGTEQSIIEVGEVWHNSFRHLQFDKKANLPSAEKIILDKMIAQNRPVTTKGREKISAKQGSSLAALLLDYKYNWNESSQSNAICIDQKTIHDFNHFKIHLLSPSKDKLNKLATFWLKELRKKKYKFSITDDNIFDDAFEFFMMSNSNSNQYRKNISSFGKLDIDILAKVDATQSEIDSSPTNGSTIAFILEFEGKNILFLGDSHEDIIIQSLKNIYQDKECYFEAIKIPHHGSNNNFSTELVNLINSNKFFISTNAAKHNHPNIEVISKIMVKENHKTLYFNYNHHVADALNNHQLNEKYNFDVSFSNKVEV
ncbi:MBL fold metallo-hydrolase [Shewanella sp. HL-SH4]|uniref:MBL fold metallo-hydrolase n=1 Tax=Shewanella sp. HL-SH4 TaxID=3436240 RepID=UPI003EB8D9D1